MTEQTIKKNNILPQEEVEAQAAFVERIREENDCYAAENASRRKAFVLTFGCQQNEADSEKLSGMAKSMGYELCSAPEQADLILVNTCAIREHAELKALSIVGQYKHLKAKNPALLIGVCGCMVTQEHRREEIKRRYPYVDFTLGTSSLHRLPQLIYEKKTRGKRLFCPEESEYLVAEGLPIHRESDYRAWVSIMYGCNNFCSYCIVPYVRGRERSREMHEVVREVRELVDKGYRDITLLGQNVNSYGKDSGYPYDFADLLAELDKLDGDFLLRFMTSHPKDADVKLIDVMANSRHIARQFHLPMQSGSDRILSAMNRHYDTARYLGIVDYMRKKMPDVTITSDIIVGFPGETEEDFEATLAMLENVRFDMLYSFIYSPRKGTPAAKMEQVPDAVKSARFERLLAVQNRIATEKNQPLVGKTVRVLCDGVSKNNASLFAGRNEGNKIVFFEGVAEDTGKFVNIRIERADAFALYGHKIEN
ncbi:MAG: tRNA (N6-isopentenyl adenosine(37)-C2)-methylthiotransferase MiaB [Clostridia bacterium]|nr:tRNA (N6-isopentenyl adenosine(37)-C2)-methylthiotransferase MiaB [Clostridia bacterium]